MANEKSRRMNFQKELLKEGKKKCYICFQIKKIEEFGYRLESCKDCMPKSLFERRSNHSLITRIRIKLGAAKHNVLKKCPERKLEFNITEQDILNLWENQNHKCYYSNIELNYNHNDPNCFSIDRKNSEIGYIKDNICLTATWINTFKMGIPFDKFIWICRKIAENTKNIQINYNISESS